MSDRFYDLFDRMEKLPEGSFITKKSDGWTWRYGEWAVRSPGLQMLLEAIDTFLLEKGIAALGNMQPVSEKETAE